MTPEGFPSATVQQSRLSVTRVVTGAFLTVVTLFAAALALTTV